MSVRMQVSHHEPPGGRTLGRRVSVLSGLTCIALSQLLTCTLASWAWSPQITGERVAVGIPIMACVFP